MTSTTAPVHPSATGLSRAWKLGIGGYLLASACTAVGTFLDLTGNDSPDAPDDDASVYLIVLAIQLGIALVAFGLGYRGAGRGSASRRSAVLGVLAALAFVVFWTGAPVLFAAASVACALVDRDRLGSFGTGSKVGLVGSALAVTANVVLAVIG